MSNNDNDWDLSGAPFYQDVPEEATREITINYAMLAATTLVLFLPTLRTVWRQNLGFFLGFLVLQVVVWMLFHVDGISLIWCGLIGALSVQLGIRYGQRYLNKSESNGKTFERVSGTISFEIIEFIIIGLTILAGFAFIIFYAIVIAPLSTVAHVLALFIGIGLSYQLCLENMKENKEKNGRSESTVDEEEPLIDKK